MRFGTEIEWQLAKRGWSKELVERTVQNPTRTVATKDVRHLPGGEKMDDAATAFYSERGGYVVRNNRTGDIVQVFDRTDAAWRAPWDHRDGRCYRFSHPDKKGTDDTG